MQVRVTSWPNLDPEAVQKIQTDTLPRLRELPGFEGALLLYERESGEAQSLVFWRDTEFMEAASSVAELERSRLEELGLVREAPSDKVFEVALSHWATRQG
jgi:hypothetical protein